MGNAKRTDISALRNTLPNQFTAGEVMRQLPELTFREAGSDLLIMMKQKTVRMVGKRLTKINRGFANKTIAMRVYEFVLKSAAVEWRGLTAVLWHVGALTLATFRSMCPTSQGAVTR